MKYTKLVSILLLIPLLVSACGSSAGKLTVRDPWARAMPQGENSAAYFVIENGTSSNDSLLSVSTDGAETAEAHMSMMDDNSVMSMQMQAAVAIPSGDKVEFKPGGLHVMLINLKQDLKAGDTFSLTLNFKEAGSIVIEIPVKEP